MINKLNELKANSKSQFVKELCESTINTLTSAIYNGVSSDAQREIERISLENIFEKLSSVENDSYVTEWVTNQKRIYSAKNIGVRAAITSLRESEGKYDQTLSSILESFDYRLQTTPEVLLYEEFVSSMGVYNWMKPVQTAVAKIMENVDMYKADVDINKVIETMKLTRSNYLVPLIEDVVDNYLKNKTEQTKSILKETLVKFSYDPYVRNIIDFVMADSVSLQLEYASANADIDTVYSPLRYLGENEVLFNVKGTFYVKKGNNINRVKNADVKNIDEAFRTLCAVINQPTVEISKKDIKVYMGKDSAVISESAVIVNSKKMSNDEFNEAKDVAKLAGNQDFFNTVQYLKENFDEIAEVEFVKRVYLKENYNYAADVFKLRENICITTYDPANNKVTFYRNINPIQAEKVMMEHMRFDVSGAFKDLLPNKDKIISQISETKEAYVTYINELNEKISSLSSMPRTAAIDLAISAINEELNEMKNEYKDYVNSSEEYTSIAEGITVTVDVDGTKYAVPIPQQVSPARGETTDQPVGTEVQSDQNVEPATQVTFDADKSELLGDNPSIDGDKVDLGVDDAEAAADAAEIANDTEGESDELENKEGMDGEGSEDDDSIDLEGLDDLGDEEGEDEEGKKKEEGKEEDESAEPLNDDLQKTPLKKKSSVVEAGEVKPKPAKKLFLKKTKMTESLHINLKKKINECVNVGDDVTYNGQRGSVTGQDADGKLIVMVQGSTHKVDPSEVTPMGGKTPTMEVPFKFDKTTLKALREQMVRCGIYMNNTPIKTSGCYVNYDQWDNSKDDQFVNVIIEGRTNMMQKGNVRILENIDGFANPDNYIPGVIIDEESGEVRENVLVNAIDYTQAIGDSAPVRIVRNNGGNQEPDAVPAAIVKTLAV